MKIFMHLKKHHNKYMFHKINVSFKSLFKLRIKRLKFRLSKDHLTILNTKFKSVVPLYCLEKKPDHHWQYRMFYCLQTLRQVHVFKNNFIPEILEVKKNVHFDMCINIYLKSKFPVKCIIYMYYSINVKCCNLPQTIFSLS